MPEVKVRVDGADVPRWVWTEWKTITGELVIDGDGQITSHPTLRGRIRGAIAGWKRGWQVPEYRAVREMRKALAPPVVTEPEDEDATPLNEFVAANSDPMLWTNAQLRAALIRLIRMELRRRGLYEEPVP